MGSRAHVIVIAAFVAVSSTACSSTANSEAPPSAAPPEPDAGNADDVSPNDGTQGPSVGACYLDENAARRAPLGDFRAPTGKYLGKCSRAAIDNLLYCTHLPDAIASHDPHCQALVPEKACIACIFNDRGAILDVKYPNVPGCIALALGETNATGCAAAYADWQRCQKDGCASCFDDKTKATKSDQHTCVERAAEQICNERTDFGRCAKLDDNPEYVHNCKEPEKLDDPYLGRLYNYFCGTAGAF